MTTPKLGDAVILLGDFAGANIGTIGVFDGKGITFNASTYKEGTKISCSGGPCVSFFGSKEADLSLEATGQTRMMKYWNWGGNSPGAGQGVEYLEEVSLWIYRGERTSPIFGDVDLSDLAKRNEVSEIDFRFDGAKFDSNEPEAGHTPFRGEYNLIKNFGNTPSDDYYGRRLAGHYSTYKTLTASHHDDAIGCGYHYTVQSDSMKTAFRTEGEFNDWINAYNLKKVECNGFADWRLIPSHPETWPEITYR